MWTAMTTSHTGDVVSVMDIIREEHAKVILLTPQTESAIIARQKNMGN
jgi:hypothetical protein